MSIQLDSLDLKVSKVRRGIGTIAHDHEFYFGDYEAVPAVVRAHVLVQMREAPEVLYFSVVAFDAHTRVPTIKRLD